MKTFTDSLNGLPWHERVRVLEEAAYDLAQLRAQVLHDMPYEVYLQSDHWQRLRRQKIEEAGGRCQACNASEELQAHHRSYADRGAEKPADLIVLCDGCHGVFHAARGLAA